MTHLNLNFKEAQKNKHPLGWKELLSGKKSGFHWHIDPVWFANNTTNLNEVQAQWDEYHRVTLRA